MGAGLGLRHVVCGIDEVVLQRRRHQRAWAVQVVGAGGGHREHLADTSDVGEQDAGFLEVLHDLLERDGGATERAEVHVGVDHGSLGLHGAVVARRVAAAEHLQRQSQGCIADRCVLRGAADSA